MRKLAILFLLAVPGAVLGAERPHSGGLASSAGLDCGKASSRVERLTCRHADLREADRSLGRAYLKLLKDAPDEEIREALKMSQRRWLKEREKEFSGSASGQDGESSRDDHALMLRIVRDRTSALSRTGGPGKPNVFIKAMLQQRADAADTTGGPFAGYQTSCFFLPAGWGDGGYLCLTGQSYQNGDRVCGVSTDWASGHVTEYRTISKVVDGRLKAVATCSTGYADTKFQCPEDSGQDVKSEARWNLEPEAATDLPEARVKLDPDADSVSPKETPWLKSCLTDPAYPAAPKP